MKNFFLGMMGQSFLSALLIKEGLMEPTVFQHVGIGILCLFLMIVSKATNQSS